jgi:hypothetical protein
VPGYFSRSIAPVVCRYFLSNEVFPRFHEINSPVSHINDFHVEHSADLIFCFSTQRRGISSDASGTANS